MFGGTVVDVVTVADSVRAAPIFASSESASWVEAGNAAADAAAAAVMASTSTTSTSTSSAAASSSRGAMRQAEEEQEERGAAEKDPCSQPQLLFKKQGKPASYGRSSSMPLSMCSG